MPLAASGHQQMTLRRAPNIWAFVVLGGILGAAAGVLVGLSGEGNAQYTQEAVTLFWVAVLAVAGLAAGAVTALVLDRLSLARARPVTTEVVDEPVTTETADEPVSTETADEDAAADAPADDPRPTDPRA